jgi:sugar/nucleoside kinase (ribokinase family)
VHWYNEVHYHSGIGYLRPADLDDVAALLDPRTIALAAPEVPLPVRARLLDLATSRGAFRVLALASAEVPDSRALIARADLVAMNAHEAAVFAGQAFDPMHPEVFLEGCRRAVEALQPSAALVVTAGANGAHGYAAGSWTRSPALKVPVASTAGAGDALLGGLLAGLAAGLPFANALELGGSVAAFSVTSPHTIPLDFTLDALVAFARRHGIALDETARLVEEVSA